jgi:hypothetical protein
MADTDKAWNIPVDRDQHNRLRRAAFDDERSAADIIREAVTQWLDRREQGKGRDQ